MGEKSSHLISTLFIIGLISLLSVLLLGCSERGPTTGTVTDIDGNEYPTVKIGKQWWMAENLIVLHYQNGDPIPNVVDQEEWSNLTTDAYSIFENDPSYIPQYGIHYNWYAATDPRGICPEGWHVPSDEDWMELESFLGISEEELETTGWRGTNQGGMLKDTDPDLWDSPLTDATNETGFSAKPAGGRASDVVFGGGFYYQKKHLAVWSSTEKSERYAFFRTIEHDKPGIERHYYRKQNGWNIRCIQD